MATIPLTIGMLETPGQVPELHHVLSFKDCRTLHKYEVDLDPDNPYPLNEYMAQRGKTIAEAATKMGSPDFILEYLQHFVVAMYPNKYHGEY